MGHGQTRGKVWRSLLARFRRDQRGVTVIEFAFVSVPFLGLLLAIMETGLVFFSNENLEASVQDAARNIMTGQVQMANVSTSSQFVSTYMCPATGKRILSTFIDCSKLIVDVRSATSFSTADLSRTFYQNPATQQFCPGTNGTIMVVRVAYPMPEYLPLLGWINQGLTQINAGLVNDVPNNPGWKHLLVGTAVFQTEPFNSGSYTPPAGC